jgi:undecaprenyl-diphosphatase
MSFDEAIFQALYAVAGTSPFIDFAAIFFAQYLAYLLIAAFFVLLMRERNWKRRFYHFSLASISIIVSRFLVTELIKILYFRPRPPIAFSIQPLIAAPESSSFPSGHAALFFALGMAVFYVNRAWGLWFLGAALLMGAARIVVGVHYPLDIAVGAAIGILSAFLIQKFLPPAGAFPERRFPAA